ncbi:MAG: succinate dehydrogenase iron-sulfur subunit [Candidatus Marsarchaeota archaeon]|jgi:succinate dehydrogenase / fumarate reductase iron-sulfur subunit|nr:succinate dehydrogenase iron-sulfur subunit [Candidatus Marsarchaeota archaeon]MCL5111695.1 succinate dehydrogenase iron-sulfur subunit [Candidatus Marsarchaeota archaeon]
MKESTKFAPMYVAMIGVPVLMVLSAIAYFVYPPATTVLFYLITLGLLAFGISGMREVYLARREPKGIPVKLAKKEAEDYAQSEKKELSGRDKEIKLEIARFNPSTTAIGLYTYTVSANRFTTVLELLQGVKEKTDSTLSMRYSCRMGICGSCGVVINGKPSLACEANVFKSAKDGIITVAPMEGHPLLKDLVNDFDDFFEKHRSIDPYLYRKDKNAQYAAKKEYIQSQEQIEKFLPYSYCIMCGLCLDACPVVNTNQGFIGPQALAQEYRYYADSRDQAGEQRIGKVDVLEGLWSCEYAGACSKVCPKGVDPATAIQLMKKEAMKSNITGNKKE